MENLSISYEVCKETILPEGQVIDESLYDENNFRIIEGFPNYKINCKGTVINTTKNNKEMTHHYTDNNYPYVQIGKTKRINRLVYHAFGKDRNNMKGLQVDHWDGEKDNNHISNLRLANDEENKANQRKKTKNNQGQKCSSPYIGISWHKEKQKWRASIQVKKKIFHVGLFKYPENGVIAYQAVARQFKPPDFWNDTLPDGFQTPIFETEGRQRKSDKAIIKIQNYLFNNS